MKRFLCQSVFHHVKTFKLPLSRHYYCCLICVKRADSPYKAALRHLIPSDSVAWPQRTHSNVRLTPKCCEVIVIVQSAPGGSRVAASVERTAVHDRERRVASLGGRDLHVGHEQQQRRRQQRPNNRTTSPARVAVTLLSCLTLKWGHSGLHAPFVCSSDSRGEEGRTLRLCSWHRTREPLYLPPCYSTVHRGLKWLE